jgi:hypothetical protein
MRNQVEDCFSDFVHRPDPLGIVGVIDENRQRKLSLRLPEGSKK